MTRIVGQIDAHNVFRAEAMHRSRDVGLRRALFAESVGLAGRLGPTDDQADTLATVEEGRDSIGVFFALLVWDESKNVAYGVVVFAAGSDCA